MKARIVELHWEHWNLSADEPAEYPQSGEPEDYILSRPHSPALAASMGDLWELVSNAKIKVLRPNLVKSLAAICVDTSSWTGDDFMKADGYGALVFSERARAWLSAGWGKYLRFEPFSSI